MLIKNRFTRSMRDNCGIISSNVLDYQVILEQHFITFLTEQGASKKTRNNYRSDLRHFIGWTMLTMASSGAPSPHTHLEFVSNITPDVLTGYKLYLTENKIPASTINRRLSAIRIFCRSCHVYGWINENPAIALANIATKQTDVHNSLEKMLLHWKADLQQEGASKSTIKNYATDVKLFLRWLEGQEGKEG